jgi:hypothetical protein
MTLPKGVNDLLLTHDLARRLPSDGVRFAKLGSDAALP